MKKVEFQEALMKFVKVNDEELRIWRERYPHIAPHVREEAVAKVEGREPQYPAPQAFG